MTSREIMRSPLQSNPRIDDAARPVCDSDIQQGLYRGLHRFFQERLLTAFSTSASNPSSCVFSIWIFSANQSRFSIFSFSSGSICRAPRAAVRGGRPSRRQQRSGRSRMYGKAQGKSPPKSHRGTKQVRKITQRLRQTAKTVHLRLPCWCRFAVGDRGLGATVKLERRPDGLQPEPGPPTSTGAAPARCHRIRRDNNRAPERRVVRSLGPLGRCSMDGNALRLRTCPVRAEMGVASAQEKRRHVRRTGHRIRPLGKPS